MDSYIRLTYASTTTSKPATIRQDLINILNEAQAFNMQQHIYGVLFYGNDYFFQCLEGEKTALDNLYEKLNRDPRHKDVALLSYEDIIAPRFDSWNMKYVLCNPDISQFFISNQHERFDPYELDQDLIHPFLNILYNHDESAVGEKEEVSAKPTSKGYVLNYKYVLFIVVLLLAVLLMLYFLPSLSVNTFKNYYSALATAGLHDF